MFKSMINPNFWGKKLFITVLLVVLTIYLFADGVEPIGVGTENDPYQVSTLDNLLWVSTNSYSWDKYFIQTDNIDASDTQNWNDGEGFSPIGINYNNRFSGSYDGQNHIIDRLFIDRPNSYSIGLFAYTENATITNLGLTNIDVNSDEGGGGLIGSNYSSEIINCYANGNIYGEFSNIGGLIGINNHSEVINCHSDGDVLGWLYTGGLIGENNDSSLTNCYSNCNVHGVEYYAGGLIGKVVTHSLIDSCYATGSVNCLFNVGGLVGSLSGESEITNSYSTGDVDAQASVGGFVGLIEGNSSINRCYSIGSVTSDCSYDVGGLVGKFDDSIINNSYYKYNEVLINGEHQITIGALYDEMYENWINNNMNLNITDYLTYDDGNYLITSIDDLKKLLAFGQFTDYNFLMTEDLDMSNETNFYIPLLAGNFDGANHIIDNLFIDINSLSDIGMFGYANDAIIKNIELRNANISGYSEVGGLVGRMEHSNITNSYMVGNIIGTSENIGGLVGINANGSSISSSYSIVTISGNQRIGGLVGNNLASIIDDCYSNGHIDAENDFVGGLVGISEDSSYVNKCYSVGDVNGNKNVGGLIGRNNDSNINNSYSNDSVNAPYNCGGLVGGNHNGNINNCYANGNVIGNYSVGGLIGYNYFISATHNSFWDIETSGQTESEGGTGKTTSEMKNVAIYTNLETEGLDMPWDFVNNPFDDAANDDIWNIDIEINSGYPYLANLIPVSADENTIGEVSSVNCLLGNYPNPFNPNTTIFYSLPKNTKDAKIEIYNLKGQRVKTYILPSINSHQTSNIVWNGKDDNGKSVGSGVYFYRLNVNGKSKALRKCVLMK